MFDVGFWELVLLFIIGLLVLGPQRLPKVAAEIGKWVGRARRTATQLRRQLEREIELDEVFKPPKPPPPTAAPPPDAEPAAADSQPAEPQPEAAPGDHVIQTPPEDGGMQPAPPTAAEDPGHEPRSASSENPAVEAADEPPRV
jgi:sec-independent protein translocase protein TatB